MPVDRRLGDFAGAWRIDRQITQADGTHAHFTGSAEFSARDGGLDYAEEGMLRLQDGPEFCATRRYVWTKDLEVLFEDGRPFHAVPPQGGQTEHVCPPDKYRVHYDFTDWPRWRVTWNVSGPRKSYCMVSVYSPRT